MREFRSHAPSCPLIVALDINDWDRIKEMAESLRGVVETVKVGLEAFTALGPPVVEMLKGLGFRLFLDLKVHDIPHTAARAVEVMAAMGVDMITLHCLGGQRMMEAAREARDRAYRQGGEHSPILLGVTVLTSMEKKDLQEVGLERDPREQVMRLARLAARSGLDGLVASAWELPELRRELGRGMIMVAPGVRPAGSGCDDQARVVTPLEAMRAGADYLVVGRPIIQSDDPAGRARELIESLQGV